MKTIINRRTLAQVIVFTICGILAMVFLIAASGKFSTHGNMYDNFIRWGYNFKIMLLTGLFEAVGSILLVIPKFRILGVTALLFVMLGAIITHLMNYNEMGLPLLPLSLSISLTCVFFLDNYLKRTI